MHERRHVAMISARVGVTVLALFGLLLTVGCSTTTTTDTSMELNNPSETSGMASPGVSTMAASKAADPDAQTCSGCAGEGVGPSTDGIAEVVDGTQVIAVGLKGGYYSPNQFKAKASMPIRVVFTGKASDCLGKPTFKSLDKSADFTATGSAIIELGLLTPETYAFTCGMGMPGGKIVVE